MIKDLMKRQSKFDAWVGKGKRVRNEIDIITSMMAEVIELNEELPDSQRHKTWKPKEYSEEKMKKELVDILFFLLQYCNLVIPTEIVDEFTRKLDVILKTQIGVGFRYDTSEVSYTLLRFMRNSTSLDPCIPTMVHYYGKVVGMLRVSHEELLELYNAKMDENYNRPDFKKARGESVENI